MSRLEFITRVANSALEERAHAEKRARLFVQLSGTAMGIALDHLERGQTSDAADMLRSTLRCVKAFLEEGT